MSKALADLLFPGITPIRELLKQYPNRSSEVVVTRIAPSPTWFLHIGTVYTGLINERFAHQNTNMDQEGELDGKFLLRIEDTDQARNTTDYEKQTGWAYSIIKWLNFFGLQYDEWMILDNQKNIVSQWLYWPYQQSQRLDTYRSFVAYLLETWSAYICFITPEELENIRTSQQLSKQATWIYGSYALSRNLTEDEIKQNIIDGKPRTIRWKCPSNSWDRIQFVDGIKGEVNTEANYIDHILLKSDGFPSYHMAHITDDYLMGVTHVIRADERLASVPFHIQLFNGFSDVFSRPQRSYNHNSAILKLDNGNRRKLSKRKDPEADVQTLIDAWYPAEAIKIFLMSLINSKFEDRWREQNEQSTTFISYYNFPISFENCNTAGAIFDIVKLNSICSDYLSMISVEQLITELQTFYSSSHQENMEVLLSPELPKILINILSFDRSKKLHTTYQDIINYILPFLYRPEINNELYPNIFSSNQVKEILNHYNEHLIEYFWWEANNVLIQKEERFEDLKKFGKQYKIAWSNWEFKEWWYIGKIGDLAMLLRIHLYGSANTPDIYEMMKALGKEEVTKRLHA